MLQDLGDIVVLFYFLSDISTLCDFRQSVAQVVQFPVFLIRQKLQYRNPIVQLKRKTMHQIINYQRVLQLKLLYYPQVLYVKPIVRLKTVISRQHRLNCPLWLVQVVHDRVCITLCWSCVHNHVVMLVHFLQKPVTIWPNVKFQHILPHFQGHICFLSISHRVNQRLIQVKDQKFLFQIEFYKIAKRLH